MTIILSPHTAVVRIFEENKGFGESYIGSMLVTWHSPTEVEIDIAEGKMTRADMKELGQKLADYGVLTIKAVRRKPHRVPGGKIIEDRGDLCVWLIEVKPTMEKL